MKLNGDDEMVLNVWVFGLVLADASTIIGVQSPWRLPFPSSTYWIPAYFIKGSLAAHALD